jgi:hypothetical protein
VVRSGRVGLYLVAATFVSAIFFLWHAPLLSEAGRIRGFNSDAAILALMGKKMFDGRGFDIFFWGQNFLGPLTSMFIALAGALTGAVGPLALRVGLMAEALVGILLVGWGLWRLDQAAATATMVALAVTPPVILRMIITPLGAEMGFVMAAALFALLMYRAPALVVGLVAGIGWWMNQQVVFTLLAAALLLGFRSPEVQAFVRSLRPPKRQLPGVVEALVWVLTWAGVLLLVTVMALDVLGMGVLPFVVGRMTDPLLMILVPHVLLAVAFRDWRRWQFPPRVVLAPLFRFAAGFVVGYAPVWLGEVLGWYERTYMFHFPLHYPSAVVTQAWEFRVVARHWLGLAPGVLGIVSVLALCGLVLFALRRSARTDERVLIALIPLLNVGIYLSVSGSKPHYLISSVAMLFALAALGACDLWRQRATLRVLSIAGGAVIVLSLGVSARAMHRDVLREPDPRPLLARVEAARCAVCYADFWIAYRYRLLDGERRAWIASRANRTRGESQEMQRLPGQRCLVQDDGTVTLLDHDLPLRWSKP